ncbi:MAG: YbjN domain-containing protein [Megasphaera sp.]|jgi:adenylate kinase family enzyme|nr:YbjN domain-containing protein [Megasphaera sp.]MCH4218342.1 YbjN domain-containing protein [Megasphaera sp.]
MNKKAEKFKKYLDEKDIKAFVIDEIADDQYNTVVFRSHIDIHGNQLPTIVILDSTIYGMVRVLVAPQVFHDDNEATVLKVLNEYNKQYKSFKYYVDDQGSLVLDTCILFKEGETDGDMIYAMFDVIINHLNDSYKKLMQAIWQ